MDNFKYQILTLQNQNIADEEKKYFSKILIFKIKLQFIVNLILLPHGLSYDELRAVSSAQIAILHRISTGTLKKYL